MHKTEVSLIALAKWCSLVHQGWILQAWAGSSCSIAGRDPRKTLVGPVSPAKGPRGGDSLILVVAPGVVGLPTPPNPEMGQRPRKGHSP